jgi:hypothetical protein
LFINKEQVLHLNKRYKAEEHPTKGFRFRPGWHITEKPHAPHLYKKTPRVWAEVEFGDYQELERPAEQGGLWYIAKWMKVRKLLPEIPYPPKIPKK